MAARRPQGTTGATAATRRQSGRAPRPGLAHTCQIWRFRGRDRTLLGWRGRAEREMQHGLQQRCTAGRVAAGAEGGGAVNWRPRAASPPLAPWPPHAQPLQALQAHRELSHWQHRQRPTRPGRSCSRVRHGQTGHHAQRPTRKGPGNGAVAIAPAPLAGSCLSRRFARPRRPTALQRRS